MFSSKSIVLFAVAVIAKTESSGIPAAVAAPLVAPAHVGYAHAVPQNIPPFASQINVQSKALSPLYAAPAIATPLAASFAAPVAAPYAAHIAAPLAAPVAAPLAAPVAARYAASFAAAPYFAAPQPVFAAPYALPAPYPYAGAGPLVRAPYFASPFVR